MSAKLHVEGLTKVYGNRPDEALRLQRAGESARDILAKTGQVVAVSDVSFSIVEGEIFTIMGLSGSGKSTLVRCLNRLIEPTDGRISVDGEDVLAKSSRELRAFRRSKVAMVFQNFALLPHKTVAQNVEFGLMIRGEPAEVRRDKAHRALAQVGLADWAERYPDNLSGGMKQRVGLARALASDPDILLMDEPFSALDPLIRSELQQELLKLQRDIRKTIVFITHDFHEAVRISDHLAIMRDGRIVQKGNVHDIVLRPADSYVATFARELDRSTLIRAGDLGPMRVPVIAHDMPAGDVRRQLLAEGRPYAIVVDSDRAPLGYVRLADMQAGPDEQPAAQIAGGTVASATAETKLSRLYALIEGNAPIAVLDEAGRTLGAVDASDIVEELRRIACQDGAAPTTDGERVPRGAAP